MKGKNFEEWLVRKKNAWFIKNLITIFYNIMAEECAYIFFYRRKSSFKLGSDFSTGAGRSIYSTRITIFHCYTGNAFSLYIEFIITQLMVNINTNQNAGC